MRKSSSARGQEEVVLDGVGGGEGDGVDDGVQGAVGLLEGGEDFFWVSMSESLETSHWKVLAAGGGE